MAAPLYTLSAFKAALACARILPRHLARALAVGVGKIVYSRNPAAQEALRSNLARISGRSGGELDALCAENVAAFSRMLADYFYCSARDLPAADRLLEEWRGWENIEAARAQGRGIIVITAHLGNWELGGALLTRRGLPMTVITLEEPSSELTRWRDAYRRRLEIRTIAVGPGHDFAFVEMIQTLRRNEAVAMLIDRPYAGTGTPVQFFGGTTEFSSAPALLWQHTEAAVVPAFVLENASGRYVSFADPALSLQKTGDRRADLAANTQRLSAHFEQIIRQHPEQSFNYVPLWKP